MKIFKDKSVLKKITIILICILVLSFCIPKEVSADDGVGGKLLNPIVDLFVGIGDAALNIIHSVIFHQNSTLITVDMNNDFLEGLFTIAVGVIVALVVAAAVVFTAGLAAAAAAAIGISLSSIGIGTVLLVSVAGGVYSASVFNSSFLPDNLNLPVYSISPEEIFSNDILLFDIDFFNPKEAKELEDGTIMESTAEQLRGIISRWYTIIRDISLVLLLTVLVYTGIRILISSTSNDKSKYKERLMDWIIAICLIFLMQYIMSFSNFFVGKITNLLKDVGDDKGYISLIEDENGKIQKRLEDLGVDPSSLIDNEEGHTYVKWKTNVLGISRLNLQMAKEENTTYAGYALIFVILVLFTIYFIFTYLKRVLYMAFLTIIAPLVALTYPIDKINDGKAQAFNTWFREYIFNLLIQPMHLLLYTVLVTSAFELASTNIIYSLVALGFMMPAEKIIRKFFGFEKASTPGLLAGPAGAAATMGIVNNLLSRGPKGGYDSNSGGKGGTNDKDNSNIKFKDSIDSDNLLYSKDGSAIAPNEEKEITKPVNDSKDKKEINKPAIVPNEDKEIDKPAIVPNEDKEINKPVNDSNKDKSSSKKSRVPKVIRNAGQRFGEEWNRAKRLSKPATIKAGAKYYGRGIKKKIENKLNNANLGKKAIRGVMGLGGAIIAGGIGIAAGVTSGDMSKAVQYTTAAGLAGYKFSKGVTNKVIGAASVEGVNDEMEKVSMGEDEYKEEQIQKNIKRIKKDDELRKELERKLKSKERAEHVLENVAPVAVRYGLEKANEIEAVYERMNAGQSAEGAVAEVKAVNELGKDTSKLGHKDSLDLNETIKDRIKRNSKGLSEEQIERHAETIRRNFDETSKILYKK